MKLFLPMILLLAMVSLGKSECPEFDVIYDGDMLADMGFTEGWEPCGSLCFNWEDGSCKFWTWYPGGVCYLQGANAQKFTDARHISGDSNCYEQTVKKANI